MKGERNKDESNKGKWGVNVIEVNQIRMNEGYFTLMKSKSNKGEWRVF